MNKGILLLLFIIIACICIKLGVRFGQTGRFLTWTPPIQLRLDETRFDRCLPEGPRYVLFNNKSILCRSGADPIDVGILVEGPFLTHFILQLLSLESSFCQQHAVRFEVFSPRRLAEQSWLASNMRGWIIIGEHVDEPLHYPQLAGKYARIGLGQENCLNRPFAENPPLFGFTTYGDCAMGFYPFPLGPLYEGERTYPFFQRNPLPMKDRTIEMDATFSITPCKLSRPIAAAASQEWCYGHGARCRLGTDWLYYVLPMSWLQWGRGANEHFESLEQTKFVLCPAGHHVEQYRIWEAILAGAIPIVEDVSAEWSSPWYVSPAFPDQFGCTGSDVHFLLKQTNAPVLYVKHWSELKRILNNVKGTEQAMQDALFAWRSTFFLSFKLQLFHLIQQEWGK